MKRTKNLLEKISLGLLFTIVSIFSPELTNAQAAISPAEVTEVSDGTSADFECEIQMNSSQLANTVNVSECYEYNSLYYFNTCTGEAYSGTCPVGMVNPEEEEAKIAMIISPNELINKEIISQEKNFTLTITSTKNLDACTLIDEEGYQSISDPSGNTGITTFNIDEGEVKTIRVYPYASTTYKLSCQVPTRTTPLTVSQYAKVIDEITDEEEEVKIAMTVNPKELIKEEVKSGNKHFTLTMTSNKNTQKCRLTDQEGYASINSANSTSFRLEKGEVKTIKVTPYGDTRYVLSCDIGSITTEAYVDVIVTEERALGKVKHFTHEGVKYMTTPGNCTNSLSPTCDGTLDSIINKTYGFMGVESPNSDGNGYDSTKILVGTPKWLMRDKSNHEKVRFRLPRYNTKDLKVFQKKFRTTIFGGSAGPVIDNYAHGAIYCSTMKYGGYSDWFLPSSNELKTLLKSGAGGFSQEPYLSSTGYFSKGPNFDEKATYNADSNTRFYAVSKTQGKILALKNKFHKIRCVRKEVQEVNSEQYACPAGVYFQDRNGTKRLSGNGGSLALQQNIDTKVINGKKVLVGSIAIYTIGNGLRTGSKLNNVTLLQKDNLPGIHVNLECKSDGRLHIEPVCLPGLYHRDKLNSMSTAPERRYSHQFKLMEKIKYGEKVTNKTLVSSNGVYETTHGNTLMCSTYSRLYISKPVDKKCRGDYIPFSKAGSFLNDTRDHIGGGLTTTHEYRNPEGKSFTGTKTVTFTKVGGGESFTRQVICVEGKVKLSN